MAEVPTVLYGLVLLMAAIAYCLLEQAIMRTQGQDSILKQAVGRDWKAKISVVLYLMAIVVALRSSRIADAVFVAAALLWLILTKRWVSGRTELDQHARNAEVEIRRRQS